jgi:hypothetical protein
VPDVWDNAMPIPSTGWARCVGYGGAPPLHKLMPDVWENALSFPPQATRGDRVRRRRIPCAEETTVVVGTGTPHPGIEDRGARYRMIVRPADSILLTMVRASPRSET